MKDGKHSKYIDLVLFLYITIGSSIITIFFKGLYNLLFLLPIFFIVYYFFKSKSPLFGASLFFLFLYLAFSLPLVPGFWLPNLGIALIVYLIISFSFNSMKKEKGWLKLGSIDRGTLFLILLIIIVGFTALLIWERIFSPDFSNYLTIIPDVHIVLLVLGIVGFSIFNAIAEEFVFRGIYWHGLEKILNNITAIILLQALFFGLSHYYGFPGGVVGILLVFTYGIFLGIIRFRSQGLLAPILTHILTDITITLIVLKNGGKI